MLQTILAQSLQSGHPDYLSPRGATNQNLEVFRGQFQTVSQPPSTIRDFNQNSGDLKRRYNQSEPAERPVTREGKKPWIMPSNLKKLLTA
jgi:hypothetical protein